MNVDDEFYVSPKDANSRADCPHEIGSDEWLEWQRNFAWEEFTKPSGQERIEAAYQRLKDRGFKVVQNNPVWNQPNEQINAICLTRRFSWFPVGPMNFPPHYHFQIPYVTRSRITWTRMVNEPPTPQSYMYEVRDYRICDHLNGSLYFAYEHGVPERKAREAAYWFKRDYPGDLLQLDAQLERLFNE